MIQKKIITIKMNKAIKKNELDVEKEDVEDRKDENNNYLDDSINKYDSDEEKYKKQDEEEEYKDEQEIEGNTKTKEINGEEDLNIGSVISKIKDFDNNEFKYEHLSYQDNFIIEEIKAFNSQKNYKMNSLQELF